MADEIPKFCALCDDETENITLCGTGDTVDAAYEEFLSNGQFDDQCAYWIAAPGDPIEVKIYSVVPVKESDYSDDDINPDWIWCLDKLVEKRIAEAT